MDFDIIIFRFYSRQLNFFTFYFFNLILNWSGLKSVVKSNRFNSYTWLDAHVLKHTCVIPKVYGSSQLPYQSSGEILEEETSSCRCQQLVNPVEDGSDNSDVTTKKKANSHCWVEMTTGNVASRYHHGHNKCMCHSHNKQAQ